MTACLILYMMEQVRPPDSGHDLVFCCFLDSLFVVFLCFWWGEQRKDCWSPAVYLFLCLSAGCGRWLRECWSHPGKQREPAAAEPGSESSRASCCFTATSFCSSTSISFHRSGLLSDSLASSFLGVPSREKKRFPSHSMISWQRTSSHSIAADFHLIPWIAESNRFASHSMAVDFHLIFFSLLVTFSMWSLSWPKVWHKDDFHKRKSGWRCCLFYLYPYEQFEYLARKDQITQIAQIAEVERAGEEEE